MTKPVLVVGSVALDDIETLSSSRNDVVGGSAVYFSFAGSFFSNIRIVGVAGYDFPAETIEQMKTHNIDTEGLQLEKGKTFKWGGKYHEDMNGRDTLYTHLNVFENFSPQIPKNFKKTPYLFLGNIQPGLQLDVLKQIETPDFIALDTMNLWINEQKEELLEVIKQIDLLTINQTELADLTGIDNLMKGISYLHQELDLEYIIIKMGEYGAYLSYSSDPQTPEHALFFSPTFPVPFTVDPTGAGDCFAGGFMGYLAKTEELSFKNMKKALVYGNIMGSFGVQDFSVDKLLAINNKEIENRYTTLRQMVKI
ncbi:MAG: sugar kinase [Candidatus Marinimicrobia bacterium]|nr:sugar kinase [Candidatus Neomarinimicrobiota bacterium]